MVRVTSTVYFISFWHLATNSLAFEVSRKSSENLFLAGQIYYQKVSDTDFIKNIYDNLMYPINFPTMYYHLI